MELYDSIQKILGGIGSIGMLIGILIAWKSGLLSFVLNLKKNGNGNNHDKKIEDVLAQFTKNLDENHLTHFKEDIKEIMRDYKDDLKEIRENISKHAEQDARIQGEILAKLQNYGK